MRFLALADDILAKVEEWLVVLLLWVMIAATFLQVSLRSLYTHAHLQWANALLGHIDWAEPLARILVLWLTFLGASLLTRERRHIKIDLLEAVLPAAWHPFREQFQGIASTSNLIEIKGIGLKRAEELELAGIRTVTDLAKRSPQHLAEKTGIPITQISNWIIGANKLTKRPIKICS